MVAVFDSSPIKLYFNPEVGPPRDHVLDGGFDKASNPSIGYAEIDFCTPPLSASVLSCGDHSTLDEAGETSVG